MPCHICITCGSQFADSPAPPDVCPVCSDERQYVGHDGQRWTTLDLLRRDHHNRFEQLEGDLIGIGTEPRFAIGQRALLVRTPAGNLLWDCLSLLDDASAERVNDLGGISAIAISHPHYYASMVEWAHAFGAEILLHEADRRWVMRPDAGIRYWSGATRTLFGGLTLINSGGHFDGGTVLHWPGGAEGRGALLSGDILQVVPDRGWLGFMYSYPNLIPLPAATVRAVAESVEPYRFDRVYGAFWDRVVLSDGEEAVRRSARRYLRALEGRFGS